jgi:UDP-N-acetylmuramyl pentapeptide phosphotransferase/UDP-N-acetylglucosamine-1-phosphate transferase
VLLVLAVPILDAAWLILERRRRGTGVVRGDRRHLHFRLVQLGMSQRQVVLLYCLISAAFGLLALTVSSRLFKLGALIVLGLVTLTILAIVTSLAERQ